MGMTRAAMESLVKKRYTLENLLPIVATHDDVLGGVKHTQAKNELAALYFQRFTSSVTSCSSASPGKLNASNS